MDFDGTLAPIVDDHDKAVPLTQAEGLLRSLSDRYALVAVISGRPVAYLAAHLADAGATQLIGQYGMERADAGTGVIRESPEAAAWKAALGQVQDAARAEAPPGAVIEVKGLAVTLHWRKAPEVAPWAVEFAGRQEAALGVRAHVGKASVELRPPVDTDKGTVVAELALAVTAVCFLGDDTGDLPAFAALARIRRGVPGAKTLAVAVAGPETPAELVAAADLVVDGPLGAMEFLEALAAGPGS